MQTHRSLIDRLQLLSSTLITQLVDSAEREFIRRRLNDVIRQWTELEQNLINEEEDITEMNDILLQYRNNFSLCEQWLKQAKDVIYELTNIKTVEILNQIIAKGKILLTDFQSNFQYLERLKTKLQRIIQTNRTSEAAQKVF